MATNTMVMSYVLRKFKNSRSSVNNRWFAYVNRQGTLSTRGLAQHMIEHGLVGNRSEVESILTKLSECVPELVAQGYGVKLDGIGIFYPVIANEKGGAESVEAFNVAQNVKGVRFKFRPDSTDLDDLTVKAFGKKVTLGNGYYKEEKGAKAPMIPLAAANGSNAPSNGGTTGGGTTGGGSSNTGGGDNGGGDNGGGDDEPDEN
jgi:predicted histone-like DNA-binding protein